MRSSCFVVFYLLISLVRDSLGNLNTKNESVDLLTFVKNNDHFNINNTLQESTNNAKSSLHIQGCGGVLTSPNGTFTSPNFPNEYENNLECGWLIRVHIGEKILLRFKEVHVERSLNFGCPYDVIEVYDEANNMATLLGHFCGFTVPKDFLSTSNQLFVRFKTDDHNTYKGFKAEYWTKTCDCGIHGTCELINGGKVCNCDSGYIQYNGECELCNCGIHGNCSFNYLREPKCICDDGYAVHKGKCYACDCGRNSTNCSFNNLSYRRERLCSCKDGFIVKRDLSGSQVCEDCDCGKDEKCDLRNGVKRCLCSTGLREVNGKCQECDCGYNAVSCELDYFKFKKCTCKEGYYAYRGFSMIDDQCSSCNCGKNSIGCYLNTRGSKLCKCRYGNVIKDELQQCKRCDCGSGGKSCVFTSLGKTQCICNLGYELQFKWETGDYCSLKESSSYGSYGWKMATYVVAVLIVVIIIGMLMVIAEKRGNLSRLRRPQR